MELRLPLDPIQVETVEYGLKNPYSIFALEMGLGKTACALAVWAKVGGTCLVVCPSYLVLNWKNEIRKFLGEKVQVTVVRKGDEIYRLWDTDIAIISYDLAQKADHFFEWAGMVVADEGTQLKSMKAKRTEAFHKYIYENSVKRLHILTGTPIKNRVEEFYSLIALCNYNPQIKGSDFLDTFPDSVTFADHFSYRQEYAVFVNNRRVTVVKWEGVKNVPELKTYLKNIYIRFVNTQEKPIFKDIQVSEIADPELLAAFEAYGAENRSVAPDIKAENALKKVPFTISYVKGLLEEVGSVVIFTDHVLACEALAEGLGVQPITGGDSAAFRQRQADDFQAGLTKVIVGTVGSFSTGFNLTAANNLVFNDYPWVPGDIQQAIFRILRRDQLKRCVIHQILGSPQDAYILKVISEKQETIGKVT